MNSDTTFVKWVILILLAITWGSSFILMELALPHYSSLEIGTLRIMFAGLALSPLVYKSLKSVEAHHWKFLFLFGLLGNILPAILFATAQQYLTSSMAGILNSTTPFFTLIVGLVLYKQKTNLINVIGVVIGFIGTILIIQSGSTDEINWITTFKYASIILLATLFYAININMLKYNLPDLGSVEITSVGFAIWFPILATVLLTGTDFIQNIQNPETLSAIWFPMVLGVLGSGGAVLLFNQLIKTSSPMFASSVTYLIPIVALIIGILYGESFQLINIAWIALVLGGVFLTNKKPKQATNE